MPCYFAGSNSKGQLGLGNLDDQSTFTRCPSLDGIEMKQVDGGANHSLVLSNSGQVYGAGDNSFNQLGLPRDIYTEFVPLELPKCTLIFAGWNTSFAVTFEGELFVAGSNMNGIAGLGKDDIRNGWSRLNIGNVKKVSSGTSLTLILLSNGDLLACGKTKYGIPNCNDILYKPELITYQVQDCAVGQYHSVILKNGQVFVCGKNNHGQLGTRQTESSLMEFVQVKIDGLDIDSDPIMAVNSGWSTISCCTSSRIFVWGRRDHGQVGNTERDEMIVEMKSVKLESHAFGSEHSLGITIDHHLVSWGWNEHGNCGSGTTVSIDSPLLIPELQDIKLVGCGGGHSLVYC